MPLAILPTISMDTEQSFMEEALEAERNLIMDQVADFETWGDAVSEEALDSAVVLCPMCQASNLQLLLQNKIICTDDGCDFCIDGGDTDQPLSSLSQLLRLTYQEHAAYCSAPLTFDISDRHGYSLLVARCHQCSLCKFFSG
jgi:hypothetical protein